jgi:predicted proteasome-type protease
MLWDIFTLTSIPLPCRRVLLDSITQVEDHLADLRIQQIHPTTGFHSDETREITIHSSRCLQKPSNLNCQIPGHGIDGESMRKNELTTLNQETLARELT